MPRLRSFASALCIILAALLVPAGIVSGWAKGQLLDEAEFVRTFAPLASEPAVQAEVSQQVMAAIEREVDIDGLTAQVFDGIVDLGLSDRAAGALRLLQQPAAAGVRSMLQGGVNDFVHSQFFAGAWERSLRASHRAIVTAATQDLFAWGAVTLGGDGEVAIQLGPIIEEAKQSLAASGFGLAAAIPVVNASFVVAQSDALVLIGVVYVVTSVLGWWLPLIAFALLAAGLLLARSRPTGITGAGTGLLIGSTALLFAFAVCSVVLQAGSFRLGVSAAALDAVFSHTVAGMRASAWWLVVVGVLLIVLGRVLGPAPWAASAREGAKTMWSKARVAMKRHDSDQAAEDGVA